MSITLTATDMVGDFRRAHIPRLLAAYRGDLQAVIDGNADCYAKKRALAQLKKLDRLISQWFAAWHRFGAGTAPSAWVQDQRQDAVREAESELAKEFLGIFDRSYYTPVFGFDDPRHDPFVSASAL